MSKYMETSLRVACNNVIISKIAKKELHKLINEIEQDLLHCFDATAIFKNV